jgi:serine protease inhibitor
MRRRMFSLTAAVALCAAGAVWAGDAGAQDTAVGLPLPILHGERVGVRGFGEREQAESAARPVIQLEHNALERVSLKWSQLKRHARSAPSPLVGEGWGGGWRVYGNVGATISRPPPPTPPHKGEGSAPSVWNQSASTSSEHALVADAGNGTGHDGTAPAAPSAKTADPLDAAYLNQAQSRLGFRLISRMSRQAKGEGNLIVSPASLAAVLSLLDLGANVEMRAALFKSLAFAQSSDETASSKLAALRASVQSVQADAGGPLTSANAIVFDSKAAPYPKMLTELAGTGAQVTVEDLDDPATIERINGWVKERTGGLIPSIIEKSPREGGLVALNALHFKDRWKDAFDPSATRPAPFHRVAGDAVEIPMMALEGKLRLREEGRFIAVELPYATDRFRLVVITTKDKPTRTTEFRPVADWLTGEGFAQRSGEIALPRFRLGSSVDLLETLDALGLHPARASPGALSGLSPVAMTIAQVLQRTEIRVDEAGTEAAAASAVTTTRSVETDFVKMLVDKPFLFALRDAATGLVLLAGYVDNPRDSAS